MGGRDASEEEETAGGRKRQGRREAEAKEKDVAREVAGAVEAAALRAINSRSPASQEDATSPLNT